jgi:ribosomal protein S18 acetylase RimI-like enzyme
LRTGAARPGVCAGIGRRHSGLYHIYADDGSQLIENVSVAPEFQGQGFGARLLAFAEVEAARNSLPRLFLYTNVKMTENLEYYPRLGYKEYKRALNQGFERVLFEKRLGP